MLLSKEHDFDCWCQNLFHLGYCGDGTRLSDKGSEFANNVPDITRNPQADPNSETRSGN